MPDYENIFLTFKLHDNWLEPNHDVPVRLATCMINLCWRKKIDSIPTSISVIKFILITVGEVLGIRLLFEPLKEFNQKKKGKYLDFTISHAITDASIQFIE